MTTDLRGDPDAAQLAITTPDPEAARTALAHQLATGDVSRMTPEQRAAFILHYCKSVGLNPATGPVEIIEFTDPETKTKVAKVYVKASAGQQLGNLHRIRVETLAEEMVGDSMFKVVVRGHAPDGRTYDEVGYVSLVGRDGKRLWPTAYKNALMKCHTVAKRRLILGMIGLSSPPDPSEQAGLKRLYLGPDGAILDDPTEEDRYFNDHPDVARVTGRPRFETMAPPTDSGLEEMPDQRPRAEDIEPPAPDPNRPRPTFKRDPESMRRLLGAWHGSVKDTSLADDEARHRFVEQWTASIGWSLGKRSSSLRTFFARATDDEAADLLAHARRIAKDERHYLAEAAAEAAEDEGREPF